MAVTIEDLLGQCRTDATNEERVVLALEAIAYHLAKIASLSVERNPDATASQRRSDRGQNDACAEAAFENEGGSRRQDWPPELDITRTTLNQFTVGKYHYSNLQDAIAQARRSLADLNS